MSNASRTGADAGGVRTLPGALDHEHLFAAVVALMGLSQVLLSLAYAGRERLIVAGGGWLLLGIAESLYSGRMTFEPWIENDAIRRLLLVASLAVSVASVVLAVRILLNG